MFARLARCSAAAAAAPRLSVAATTPRPVVGVVAPRRGFAVDLDHATRCISGLNEFQEEVVPVAAAAVLLALLRRKLPSQLTVCFDVPPPSLAHSACGMYVCLLPVPQLRETVRRFAAEEVAPIGRFLLWLRSG